MVKMKNATCMALPRPRFMCRKGRSKSIDAPIVPIKFARMLLLNRNVTFASGEAGRGMCKWIAPATATTKNVPTTTMKVAYSPAACCARAPFGTKT